MGHATDTSRGAGTLVLVMVVAALGLGLGAACGSNGSSPDASIDSGDAASPDGAGDGGLDAGADAGPEDAGPADAGEVDAGPADAGDAGGDGGDAGDPDAGDAGDLDAGEDGGVDAGPPVLPGVYYGPAAFHSPITDDVAARLRAFAAATPRDEHVFSKVGDSISTGWGYMACFAQGPVVLDGRDALQEAIDWFRAGDAGGTTPFDRDSLATAVGLHAFEIIEGSPSRLEQEVAAVSPRMASVMLGTNDVQWRNLDDYLADMLVIVDSLTGEGIVPIMSTIPPREDDPAVAARVPLWNAAIRGMAQGRQVPLVNLHLALLSLPNMGLRDDHVHLSYDNATDLAGTCDFTPEGLQYGEPLRNLLTLEALYRVWLALAGTSSDLEAPRIEGDGSFAAPAAIPALPFGDLRDAGALGSASRADYPGCGVSGLAGPEVVYRLDLARDAHVEGHLAPVDGDAPVLLLLDAAGTCLTSGPDVAANLVAGTYLVVVESTDPASAGEYVLALVSP